MKRVILAGLLAERQNQMRHRLPGKQHDAGQILPALRTDLSYWNWYAFPGVYTAAQFIVNIVGFCVAGLVLAKMIATPAPTPRKVALAAA
jgi:hypothetical protein